MKKYYVYTVNSDAQFVFRTKDDLQEKYLNTVVKTKGVGLWRFEYEG